MSEFQIDESVFDFLDLQKALHNHYDQKKLKILVCGKTGCGKSTLLNTILGRYLFEIGGPGNGDDDDYGFEPVTENVTSVCTTMQNILLEIFDSPGLQDGTGRDGEYLDDMHTKCKDVDLILYCVDMTIARWTPQEVKATKLLTEKFGEGFWTKSIVVLTKANMVKPPHTSGDDKAYCKRAYCNFVRKFQTQLTDQGVSPHIANGIPVVAAGSDRDRYLSYVSKIVSENAEHRLQDFLPELWVTCFERTSGNSRFNFLKVTDFSSRITVKKDCLPPDQKEMLEEFERQYKEKEELLKQHEKKLNEKIMQLTIEKQQEIEEIRKQIQSKYPPNKSQALVQQQPIDVTKNVLKKAAGATAGATAGAMIGSFFGPVGTAIGAAVGAVASATACSIM